MRASRESLTAPCTGAISTTARELYNLGLKPDVASLTVCYHLFSESVNFAFGFVKSISNRLDRLFARLDRVVPVAVKRMRVKIDCIRLLVADFVPFLVYRPVERAAYLTDPPSPSSP